MQFDSTGVLKTLFIGHAYVTFHEDKCRIRSLHSPHNFALLRRIALNALEREKSFRRSIRQKSRRAAMNDQYMVSVLTAAVSNSIPIL